MEQHDFEIEIAKDGAATYAALGRQLVSVLSLASLKQTD